MADVDDACKEYYEDEWIFGEGAPLGPKKGNDSATEDADADGDGGQQVARLSSLSLVLIFFCLAVFVSVLRTCVGVLLCSTNYEGFLMYVPAFK